MRHQAIKVLEDNSTTLLSAVDDESPLYSGMAETLYEYAFDTILPKYTPLFEEEISSKTTKFETISENYPYAIYPNPTSDFINIELCSNEFDDDIIEFLRRYGIENIDDCATIEVNIYDINSRLLCTNKYKYDTLIIINVSEYLSGTYMVEIKSCYNNETLQTKIIKI